MYKESNKHKFTLSNFNGPLDLLLFLIKDKKMDIFEINLLELAQQYLEYISKINNNELENASEYLVMASTLIQIKSQALLKQPDDNSKLEVNENKLLLRLAEYQQFKMVKKELQKKEQIRMQIFTKEPENIKSFERPIDNSKIYGNSDPVKLLIILRKMFERTHAKKQLNSTISTFNLSPKERANQIRKLFKNSNNVPFKIIFNVPSIKHFLVTILALLDLAKRQEVKLIQNNHFDNIEIVKGINYGK